MASIRLFQSPTSLPSLQQQFPKLELHPPKNSVDGAIEGAFFLHAATLNRNQIDAETINKDHLGGLWENISKLLVQATHLRASSIAEIKTSNDEYKNFLNSAIPAEDKALHIKLLKDKEEAKEELKKQIEDSKEFYQLAAAHNQYLQDCMEEIREKISQTPDSADFTADLKRLNQDLTDCMKLYRDNEGAMIQHNEAIRIDTQNYEEKCQNIDDALSNIPFIKIPHTILRQQEMALEKFKLGVLLCPTRTFVWALANQYFAMIGKDDHEKAKYVKTANYLLDKSHKFSNPKHYREWVAKLNRELPNLTLPSSPRSFKA
jgi:hypothetical protein